MSLNKAILIGRLTADPETRYTQSNTAVANFSLATNERFTDRNGEKQETTEFHRIVAWGRLAEICQEYLKKGSLIYVEGPISTRKWQDKDGTDRYTTEIKALTMQMLDSKGDSRSDRANSAPTEKAEPDNFDDMDSDLPFSWVVLLLGSGLVQIVMGVV